MPKTKVNKGEWSELYVLLKLLADGKMYGSNEKGEQVKDSLYPISAINHKTMNGDDIRYEIVEKSKIKISLNGVEIEHQAQQDEISLIAKDLLSAIKKTKGSSFEVPHVSDKLEILMFPKTKAPNNKKQDISIIIRDTRLCKEQEVAFSIKSQLGRPSTLFNPSKGSNFLFQINGLEKEENSVIEELKKEKGKALIQALVKLNHEIEFVEICGKKLDSNMALIDANSKHIWSFLLIESYKMKRSTIKDLTEIIIHENPLEYTEEDAKTFYPYKIKHFLTAVALGMTSSKLWKGEYDVSGGYIIVKNDGELACYHIYNWNAFQNYLFTSTCLEGASGSRYEYGELSEKDGKYFVKLNLQIRFIS